MQARERAVGQAQADQPAWVSVVSISYFYDHPAGYRSCIIPTAAGAFSAYVEIEGLLRLHAPQPFSSLSQAQAWCLESQRSSELQELC